MVLMTPQPERGPEEQQLEHQGLQQGEEAVQGGQDGAALAASGPGCRAAGSGGGSGGWAARGCGHVCVRRVRQDIDPELFWGLCGAGER